MSLQMINAGITIADISKQEQISISFLTTTVSPSSCQITMVYFGVPTNIDGFIIADISKQ